MALETLINVKQIDGNEVTGGASNFSADRPIMVNHESNQIAFQIQDGPIKEVGKNGCQVTALISAAKMMIEGLNAKFPCRENAVTITKLDEALMWQQKRTMDRIARDVDGFSKE